MSLAGRPDAAHVPPTQAHAAPPRSRFSAWLAHMRHQIHEYRAAVVLMVLMALLVAWAVTLLSQYGEAFYRYAPIFYEPKDEERRGYLERKHVEDQLGGVSSGDGRRVNP
jgi:hypothetical protein